MKSVRKAIYPGSFDPITKGHIDIIDRVTKLFDHLVITIATNRDKEPLFDLEQRKNMIEECTRNYSNLEVTSTGGLVVEYAKSIGACALIRGLRFVSDIEFEFQMAWMNRRLSEEIVTVFLMTDAKYTHLNSTIIREVSELGGDVHELVPPGVALSLREKFSGKR
ncbi:MAG: pantetheine-phosphate adenylyltransferase [Candidatus Neomarinimicrobiota bacterium]